MSMPRSDLGNVTPQSTTRICPATSKARQFMPISPRPPRGTTRRRGASWLSEGAAEEEAEAEAEMGDPTGDTEEGPNSGGRAEDDERGWVAYAGTAMTKTCSVGAGRGVGQ